MSNARNLSKLKPSSSGLIEIDDVDSSVTQKFSFRNRIINGAMMIDQRNAGASVTPTSASTSWILDRWQLVANQNSKYSAQQNAGSVTPPAGFTKYLGTTSLSAYTPTTGDIFQVKQVVEGYNVADFGFGTASAVTSTVSFWVRSSITGNFGVVMSWGGSGSNQRTYPILYTINSANTWEFKTITIAGDTGTAAGGFETTNGGGIQVRFCLGAGSDQKYASGSWVNANAQGVTGQTDVVATNGATFYITGVQLEKGSAATPFEYRPYGQELALCQRYYWQMISDAGQMICTAMYYSASAVYGSIVFPIQMRTTPSLSLTTGSNYYIVERAGATNFISSLFILKASSNSCGVGNNTEASGTSGYAAWITSNTSAKLGFSAEL